MRACVCVGGLSCISIYHCLTASLCCHSLCFVLGEFIINRLLNSIVTHIKDVLNVHLSHLLSVLICVAA